MRRGTAGTGLGLAMGFAALALGYGCQRSDCETPADVSGAWTGSFTTSRGPRVDFQLHLEQRGTDIEGWYVVGTGAGRELYGMRVDDRVELDAVDWPGCERPVRGVARFCGERLDLDITGDVDCEGPQRGHADLEREARSGGVRPGGANGATAPGRAGAGARAGTRASGGAGEAGSAGSDATVVCGGQVCGGDRPPAPMGGPLTVRDCCTAQDRCGMILELNSGQATPCFAIMDGTPDPSCAAVALPLAFDTPMPSIEPCCRPDGLCGTKTRSGASPLGCLPFPSREEPLLCTPPEMDAGAEP